MRGYQKRVIHIKNTRSFYFDEAYFVIKPQQECDLPCEAALVAEANRIISESFVKKNRYGIRDKRAWIFGFIFGAALSLIPTFILIF